MKAPESDVTREVRILRVTSAILASAFLALVILIVKSKNVLIFDEVFFANYVALLHSHGLTVSFLRSLNAKPGPLCAFVQTVFSPATLLEPKAMRFVNLLLLGIIAVILAVWLKRSDKNYLLSACSVLVVPMTWVVGGMALSEAAAMLFVTLSLYLQLRGLVAHYADRSSLPWFLGSGLCLGIAVWGRQPYLLLVGIPLLVSMTETRLRLSALVFAVTTAAIAIPLFVIWGGLVPPSEPSAAGFSFVYGLTSFGYVGVCFLLLGARPSWLRGKLVIGMIILTFVANGLGIFWCCTRCARCSTDISTFHLVPSPSLEIYSAHYF